MNDAVLGCIVEGYEAFADAVELPDPDDRHVLAAAIAGGVDGIVTFNERDFPLDVARRYELDILHPDTFLVHQLSLNPAPVLIAAKRCRERLRRPPLTAREYLDTLRKLSLPLTVAELEAYIGVL